MRMIHAGKTLTQEIQEPHCQGGSGVGDGKPRPVSVTSFSAAGFQCNATAKNKERKRGVCP